MWWGTVLAWMCGNVPSWWYDPGGFSLPSGPLGGFGSAPSSPGGGSSDAPGRWLIPPPTGGAGPTGLSYSDLWSRSLPSVSGPTAGVPNAALQHRSGSQQVRDFLLARYAQDRAAFDAYTDYLSSVALTAAAGPVLAYAGVGTLLGYAGVELAGLGAAQTAATVIGMGLGAHEVQQGIETGSKTRIAVGVLAGVPWLGAVSRVRGVGAALTAAKAGRALVNVSPTVAELRALGAVKGFHVHHILPEYLGKMLGYTPKQMLGHPGTLVSQWSHTGTLNPKALHTAISKYLPPMAGGHRATYSAGQIRAGLQRAYADIGRSDLFGAIEHLIR